MKNKLINLIRTFIFLHRIKTKNLFIYLYLYFRLKRFIVKKMNKKLFLKKKNIISNFYEKKQFKYGNFFFENALNLHDIIVDHKFNENQKYLEIGSFEGSSLIYFSKVLKNSSFVCVDIWKGEEELSKFDFEIVEKNFNYNCSDIDKDKITINKTNSRNFFIKNKNKFSIIYLDGNHSYKEVLNDLNESFKILLNGGIIILDDYTWSWYVDPKNNPGYAINLFLKENYSKLQILSMTEQVIIKKIHEY